MVIKITGTILLMLLAMRFFEKIADIILLSLASVFLAVALNPAVIKIRRSLGIKRRGLAISLAFGLIVVAMITIFMVTVPPVFNQISDFAEDLPQKVEDFRKELPEVFSDVAPEPEPEPDSGVVAQSESEPEPEPGLVNRIADYFKRRYQRAGGCPPRGFVGLRSRADRPFHDFHAAPGRPRLYQSDETLPQQAAIQEV